MNGTTIHYSNRFKRQFKKLRRAGRGATLRRLQEVLEYLLRGEKLPDKFRHHGLTGQLLGFWECHIEPDWLLIYRRYDDLKIIELAAMGNHGELFK